MKTKVIKSILATVLFSTLTLTSCEENHDYPLEGQESEMATGGPTTPPDPEKETEDDEPNGGREICHPCSINDSIIKKDIKLIKPKNR
jgi:hypothetical protein